MNWTKIVDGLPDYDQHVTILVSEIQERAYRTHTDYRGEHWYGLDNDTEYTEEAVKKITHWHPPLDNPIS